MPSAADILGQVTAQTSLRAALRAQVAPAARQHGYQGSAPTWRKSSASGDWAVVNIQSSSFSSAQHLRCVVNLAFAPEPWLRWQRASLGARMPKSIPESLGLYRVRLHPEGSPAGTDLWWDVVDDSSADEVASDMSARLERDGWPLLDSLFSNAVMLAQVRGGDLGDMKRTNFGVYFSRVEALLLMDEGPSSALDEQLDFALLNVMPAQRENAENFDRWVRAEARRAGERGEA